MIKKLAKKATAFAIIASAPAPAATGTSVPEFPIVVKNDWSPKTALTNFIDWSLFFIGAIALIFVVWGGILFITSAGDADKTTKARNTLMYAVIGIVVVVLSYAIVHWAGNVFGPVDVN